MDEPYRALDLGETVAAGGQASVLSCVINLASTCMGTGILALPYAFHLAGFTAGCMLCTVSAFICMLSLYMLFSSGWRIKGPVNFASLCEAAYPGSGLVIDFMVVANCVGTATSYLIVATDCFSALGAPRSACVVLSTLAVTPAALFKTMDTLKVSSSIAICCLIGIVVMVVCFGFGDEGTPLDPCPGFSSAQHGHCGGKIEPLSSGPLAVFCTVPYFAMAFSCQQNAFNAIGELSRPTSARQIIVCVCSPILPLILYLAIAICGYLTFGDRAPSNIINGYPHTSLVSTARTILGVVVLCNYPLQMFPSRVSTLSFLDACGYRPGAASKSPASADGSLFIHGALELRITAIFLLVTSATALFVTDLGSVVALIGSTGSTAVVLLCPAAAHLLLARDAALWLRIFATLMLLLGLALLPSSLFCGS